MIRGKRVLFLVNRDFVLYNFRLELAQRLLKEHYEVYICLPYGPKVDEMTAMGCHYIPIDIDTRGTNLVKDVGLMRRYRQIFREIAPDIILTYTTKVCIYAGIISGSMHIPYLVNISGLGTAVADKSMLQAFMLLAYRLAARRAQCLFFQNQSNQIFFQEHQLYHGRWRLIPGSGVNLEHWQVMPYPSDIDGVQFFFIARIIKEKGIEEYLNAARVIHEEYPDTVFHVLGPCDGDYAELLVEYERLGSIRYHGMVRDTRPYLQNAHCTIHPSYYPEGISNVLLESAACGRPVITTDQHGCAETVDDGRSGYIVPKKNTDALIDAIRRFLALPNAERQRMGLVGRAKMEHEFDRQLVTQAYMEEIENGLQKAN